MADQSERKTCEIYVSPDERRLLEPVALGHGVGRDYLALAGRSVKSAAPSRAIPRWLGRPKPLPAPAARHPRSAPQSRRCHSCTRLARLSDSNRCICTAGVWASAMIERSVRTSLRLRRLSLTCLHYAAAPRPERKAPRHCRACCELALADTIDERYLCSRSVWTNPMKLQSVANAVRLTRLSASCPHYAPTSGRWLSRSAKRRSGD